MSNRDFMLGCCPTIRCNKRVFHCRSRISAASSYSFFWNFFYTTLNSRTNPAGPERPCSGFLEASVNSIAFIWIRMCYSCFCMFRSTDGINNRRGGISDQGAFGTHGTTHIPIFLTPSKFLKLDWLYSAHSSRLFSAGWDFFWGGPWSQASSSTWPSLLS